MIRAIPTAIARKQVSLDRNYCHSLFCCSAVDFWYRDTFFGTPTLILLGYSFEDTLAVVLPASISVSFLQLIRGSLPQAPWRGGFAVWCLVPMTTILGASLWWRIQFELEFVIASTLFLYVLIRVSPRLHGVLQHSVQNRKRSWLAIIGIIHGLSNLGGGLLAIFSANSFGDKLTIRNYIAFCYPASQLSNSRSWRS